MTLTPCTSLSIRHNMEMAHRLFLTPGKCEQIHGHSWWVTLTAWGHVDANGLMEGIDFSELKNLLRSYMDRTYDHRLLLNRSDPWAGDLTYDGETYMKLPGLVEFDGDPTTELLAQAIGQDMISVLGRQWDIPRLKVDVWETSVNNASWSIG
jgi:6-pyruvoyltetrahydropterin/6-carboxytetrahydropterin synthase